MNKLLTCLPLFPGRPVGPLFPEIPGSPFGPISPCTTNQINSICNFCKTTNSKTFIVWNVFLTFCPSIPGKPIAPCGERKVIDNVKFRLHTTYMHYRAATFTVTTATDKLCPPCRLSFHSPHDHLESPDGADCSVLHHI